MAQKIDPITAAAWAGGLYLAYRIARAFSSEPAPPPGPVPPAPTGVPTLSAAQIASMAQQLRALLTWYITEDEPAALDIIARCGNDADVAWLVHAYGTPWNWWKMRTMGLPDAIATYFDADERADLNAALSAKGITFRF